MAKLTKKDLDKLPDSMFGIPETRSYPLVDEEHVRKAIQFFKYAEKKYRNELAKNINRRAKELKMKIRISKKSAFYPYADKAILASDEEVKSKKASAVKEFNMYMLAPIVGLQTTADEIPNSQVTKPDTTFRENNAPEIITTLDKIFTNKEDPEQYVSIATENLRSLNRENASLQYQVMEELGELDHMRDEYRHHECRCECNDEELAHRLFHMIEDCVERKAMNGIPLGKILAYLMNIKSAIQRAKLLSFIVATGFFDDAYCHKLDDLLSHAPMHRPIMIDPDVKAENPFSDEDINKSFIHDVDSAEHKYGAMIYFDHKPDVMKASARTSMITKDSLRKEHERLHPDLIHDKEMPHHALESLTEGASIDSVGNISFSFVPDGSWVEKLHNMVQPIEDLKVRVKAPEQDADTKDTEAINNLAMLEKAACVLFAFGATLRQNYVKSIDIDKASLDYIDAEKAYQQTVAYFKPLMAFITAIDRNFVFLKYYTEHGFLQSINIPEITDYEALKSLYYFFMN